MSQLNTLIDLIDGFIAGETFDDRWKTANTAVISLGACALNIGEFDMDEQSVKWISSSMSKSWMTRYVEREYFEADEIIEHGKRSFTPYVSEIGHRVAQPGHNDPMVEIDRDLHDFGYRGFIAQSFRALAPEDRMAVSFVTDRPFDEIGIPDLQPQVSRVAGVISAFIGSPFDGTARQTYFLDRRPLTTRERDVLAMLAAGQLYSRIADRLGIAEITVRKHVQSARGKLGAATRDQAIAIREQLIAI